MDEDDCVAAVAAAVAVISAPQADNQEHRIAQWALALVLGHESWSTKEKMQHVVMSMSQDDRRTYLACSLCNVWYRDVRGTD